MSGLKSWAIVVIIVVCVIILSLAAFELVSYANNEQQYSQAVARMKLQQYDVALDACDLMAYGKIRCYGSIFGLKMQAGSVDEAFCDRIPTDERYPFWFARSVQARQDLENLKADCRERIL